MSKVVLPDDPASKPANEQPLDEREKRYQEQIQRLEQDKEQLRREASERDSSYRERLAAAGAPVDAILGLERSFSAQLPSERNPKSEADMKLACQIFGPGSDSGAANRLAISSIGEYRRLKQIARKLGRV